MEFNVVVVLEEPIEDDQINRVLDALGRRLAAAVGWDQATGRAHVTVSLMADDPLAAAEVAVREVEATAGTKARAFEVLPTIDFDTRYGLNDAEV